MSHFEGNLLKMETTLADEVQYHLPIGEERVHMNPLIGQPIKLHYHSQINCVQCGKITPKSFGQGFCYPCFAKSPLTEECVLRPELCQAHDGIARDMEYAETHCLIDHYVYFALSSGVKVGVTRHTQKPTRWIDQGASEAIIFAQVPNRNLAGQIEVALKEHMSDKTNWQRMLKNQIVEGVDLVDEKESAYELLPDHLQEYVSDDDEVTVINYPVQAYPAKVKSTNFDKVTDIEGKLVGIKGQYLIFEDNTVVNIRRHGGYKITLETGE